MSNPILAIDPGTTESGYAVLETPSLKPLEFGTLKNDDLLRLVKLGNASFFHFNLNLAIEMPASYGQAVGHSIFETCFWVGRFWDASSANQKLRLFRKADICVNVCRKYNGSDSMIIKSLVARFGDKGTKKNPGWFYGVSGDVWQAIAVGVTAWDRFWSPEAAARGRGDVNPKVEDMRRVK